MNFPNEKNRSTPRPVDLVRQALADLGGEATIADLQARTGLSGYTTRMAIRELQLAGEASAHVPAGPQAVPGRPSNVHRLVERIS